MEAGVAVAGPRPSFRKPSHDTSQRNYRRRSPSTSSRSTSSSPSPARAPSGGWKRDRSASPSSPRKDGLKVNSMQAKKGKTAHKGDDSDDSNQGRREYGPGTSDRHGRGSSYDRPGKSDPYDSRRPSAAHSDRNHQTQAIHSSRDSHGDVRRNGDYDHSSRSRHSPDRGHRDRERRRDSERDRDRSTKGNVGGREGNNEKDSVREGRLERDRNRDRSRSRPEGRESLFDKESDLERRSGGGRGRDNNREREREREKYRDREREAGRIKSKHGDIGVDLREPGREKVRDKERGRDRYHGKTGARDTGSPRDVDGEKTELVRDRGRDREKKYRDNMEKESDYEKDGGRNRISDSGREKEKTKFDEKTGRDVTAGDTNRDKDLGRSRDRGKGRDRETYGNRDDSKSQERRREPDRYPEDDPQDRSLKSKEDGREGSRVKDRNELKDRTRHKEKDEPRELQKVKNEVMESGDPDLIKVKEETSPLSEGLRVTQRQDKERAGNRTFKNDLGLPYEASRSDSRQLKEREVGKAVSSSDVGFENDGSDSACRGKVEGSEQLPDDGARNKDKVLLSSNGGKKEKQPTFKRSDTDGSSKFSSKDGEATKDRSYSKEDFERATEVKNTSAPANDSDKTGSDSKVLKGTKWGPETGDSNVQASASEEVANDLSAAKLAALKAAELVNKNLGVPGFMSADQKKKLLWGSKKSSAEQEQTIAAGSNRWDTVHFSDPDRQEKFHKLMSLSVLRCHWPISGRESGFQRRRQERRRYGRRFVYGEETAGATARPGEAVCCRLEAKRWSNCRTWVVNEKTHSGFPPKRTRICFFLTRYEGPCEDAPAVMHCEVITAVNSLISFTACSVRRISSPSEDKLNAGKFVPMISALSWSDTSSDLCLCTTSRVCLAPCYHSVAVYLIHCMFVFAYAVKKLPRKEDILPLGMASFVCAPLCLMSFCLHMRYCVSLIAL